MQVRTQIIGGEVYNDHDRPPKKFTPGRICAEPDCLVYLSIYNEDEFCSAHREKVAPRMRGRKLKQKA